ncbi:MAG: 16S rRNA (uracil(1498)-N(3))-methyltransferase [Pseudomonadota bacterium]
MSNHRLYVDQTLEPGSKLELSATQAHYLSRVLRVRTTDRILVFDGNGLELNASVELLTKNSAQLDLASVSRRDPKPDLAVTLIQAIAKGEKMDWILQKCTELGVTHIQPVVTKRTVVKLDKDKAQKRLTRWQSVMNSACEQSGRTYVPTISEPTNLSDALKADVERKVLFAPTAKRSLKDLDAPSKTLAVLIGPEGGLDELEIQQAVDQGFDAVRLGPRILRTETAAVTGVALVQSLWGDLG